MGKPHQNRFNFWKQIQELHGVEIEPLLACWEANDHRDQIRMQSYLDILEKHFSPHLVDSSATYYLNVDVVRPGDSDLLYHCDLENYLTPIAQRFKHPKIVLAQAVKRHPNDSTDHSRISVGIAERGKAPLDWRFFSVRATGSYEHKTWKEAIRKALIDQGASLAPQGALAMDIAFRASPPPRRNWVYLWKPAGDAVGPILGEPDPTKPFNPSDDRITRLALHFTPAEEMGPDVEIGVWYQPH